MKGFKVVNFCNHIVLIAGRFKKGLPQGTILGKAILKKTHTNDLLRNILGRFCILFLKMYNSNARGVAQSFMRN